MTAGSRRLPRRVATREVEMIGSVVHYKGAAEDQAGFLRRRRVGPAGRSKYLHAAGLFRAFCRERRLALAVAPDVDHALDLYLVQLFAKQRLPLQQAREVFDGVRFAYDLQNQHLPLAHASLDGYKREDPDSSREPCPWEVATMAALDTLEHCLEQEAPLIAAAILLDFDCYARPGAICGLQCRSLIAVDDSRFCIVFFPGDREERSKARTQDDTVEVGIQGREWLREVARALLETRRGPHKLFGISQSTLRRHFAAALDRLSLKRLGYTPHCLRHGGASADANSGLDAVTIQLGGQWRSPKSVVRYMKRGAYLRQLARLSKTVRAAATSAEKSLRRRLPAEIRRRAPRCTDREKIVSVPERNLRSVPLLHDPKLKRRRTGDGVWAPKTAK